MSTLNGDVSMWAADELSAATAAPPPRPEWRNIVKPRRTKNAMVSDAVLRIG